AEDGIRDFHVTGVQTCALPISQEPHDPRLGVAEEATDRGLRTETGKPKRTIKPAWFSHPGIMPDFSPRSEEGNPRNQGVSRPSRSEERRVGKEWRLVAGLGG